MTQQEFIDAYCARGGVTWEWLSTRRDAVPCDCGEPGCDGWAMVPKDEVSEQAQKEQA